MPWSQSNDVKIYYEVVGEGPALILLHANPFDHTMWVYQIARFSRRFTVVAIDLRGYGRSDKPEYPFTFLNMAEDVISVIRDRRLERVALAGVSIGATLALQIALDCPDLVQAVVLVGGESGNPPVFASLAHDYAAKPIETQRLEHIRMIVGDAYLSSPIGRYFIESFLESTPQLSGNAIAQIFRARKDVNLQSRLATMATPALVVNGATDVSLESGRDTARRIPGAMHKVIPAAGHICCLEKPWEFDRVVLEFLAGQGYDVG